MVRIKDGATWQSPLSKHLSDEVKGKLNEKLQCRAGDLVFLAAGVHDSAVSLGNNPFAGGG